MAAQRREDIRIPSHGQQLAAYLYRPTAGDRKVPCVVMAHGFTCTRDDGLPAYAETFRNARVRGHPVRLPPLRCLDRRAAPAAGHRSPARRLPHCRGLGTPTRRRRSRAHCRCGALRSAAVTCSPSPLVTPHRRGDRKRPFVDALPTLTRIPLKNVARLTLAGLRDQAGAARRHPPHLLPAVGDPGTLAVMTAPDAEPGLEAIEPPESLWRNEFTARLMLTLAFYRQARKAPRITMPLLVCVCDEDSTTPAQPGDQGRATRTARRAQNLCVRALRHLPRPAGEGRSGRVPPESDPRRRRTEGLTRHHWSRGTSNRHTAPATRHGDPPRPRSPARRCARRGWSARGRRAPTPRAPRRTDLRRVRGIPSAAPGQLTPTPSASWHTCTGSAHRRPRSHPRAAPPPGSAATTTPRAPRGQRLPVNGRTNAALPWRTTRLAISHWSPPPGTTTIGTPASSALATMPCPPPQTATSASASSHPGVPSPTTAHGGTRLVLTLEPRHHHPRPVRQRLPRHQVFERHLGQAVRARSSRSTVPRPPTARPLPARRAPRTVGSKCSGPTTTASAGQSGRGTSSAGSVAISRRSGPGPFNRQPDRRRAPPPAAADPRATTAR